MSHELKVPSVGESITEVQIGDWLVSEGDAVEEGQALVEIESDKATLEVPAPVDGVLSEIKVQTGTNAAVGDVIGLVEEGDGKAAEAKDEKPKENKEEAEPQKAEEDEKEAEAEAKENEQQAKAAEQEKKKEQKEEAAKAEEKKGDGKKKDEEKEKEKAVAVMPAARRAMAERGLEPEDIEGTGPGGRILKEDVLKHKKTEGEAKEAERKPKPQAAPAPPPSDGRGARDIERKPMSPMRKRIAERLVQAQQQAAILTTFNEVDMSKVVAIRNELKEEFQEKYGIKLGFMSFFIKASVEALRTYPQVNAQIDGDDLVFHHYQDIGIAVGGGKGLVVPIIRNAESLSFGELEQQIADFGKRAQENKIDLEELQGGTFTISNGGVYGSLNSTPILNPPQAAILGLHAIQDRPMAVDGEVQIRPMMYLALSYDHRIIDGREAVTFLRHIKFCIENPTRILVGL